MQEIMISFLKATAFNFAFADYFFAWGHQIRMEYHNFTHFVGSRALNLYFFIFF